MISDTIEIRLRRASRGRVERPATDPRVLDAAFACWEDAGRRLDSPARPAPADSQPGELAAIVGEQLSQLNRQRLRLESLLAQIEQDDA
ncbi:hypothetical protein Pla175_16450 [Pirellulimonas nuda]|uniref:Uncharacterized protein n=1 Tax=Pirellulimonas nuda TaxID=2528009 RepID=A0A518D9V6_9BACT|nr:hypothetical protein [Pirellulimonas nuda]QDU88271.1 hypothetical protein Pla175_16450 [Pirellulimonas nuda]